MRILAADFWSIEGVSYSLIACPACGCVATDPIPTPAALAQHYRDNFNFDWYRDHLPAKYVDAKRRLLELKPWLGRRILDFGGGLGYLSRAARRLGHDSITVDPYRGDTLSEIGRWDTVFALHVLEHVPNPPATLALLHECLEPGGTLVLAVPNALGRGYREAGTEWTWFQAPITHLYHFTPMALARLVARSGFSLLGLTFHERWDANTVADIEHRQLTRMLGDEWQDTDDRAARQAIARRNSRYRFQALRTCRATRQNDQELAEIVLVARRPTTAEAQECPPSG